MPAASRNLALSKSAAAAAKLSPPGGVMVRRIASLDSGMAGCLRACLDLAAFLFDGPLLESDSEDGPELLLLRDSEPESLPDDVLGRRFLAVFFALRLALCASRSFTLAALAAAAAAASAAALAAARCAAVTTGTRARTAPGSSGTTSSASAKLVPTSASTPVTACATPSGSHAGLSGK